MQKIDTVTKRMQFLRALSIWIILASLVLSGCAAAKPKVYRVGVLAGLSAFSPALDGFKAKMTELGYIEGKNIEIGRASCRERV